MIDVYLTALLSDWLTQQEENSSCKFGALQVIKVGRAGVYYKTGNEKRPTFRKSTCYPSSVHNRYPATYIGCQDSSKALQRAT